MPPKNVVEDEEEEMEERKPKTVSLKALRAEEARLRKNIEEHRRVIPPPLPPDLLNITDEEGSTFGEAFAVEMNEEMKQTVAYCKKTILETKKDRITTSEEWKRKETICQNAEHFMLTDKKDVDKIETNVSPLDMCLIVDPQSGDYRDLFNSALLYAIESKKEARGPNLSVCLAWLAYAAQTPLEKIIPPGKDFEFAREHIKKKLRHPRLKNILKRDDASEKETKEQAKDILANRIYLASIQICQVFNYLSVSTLFRLLPEKRAILLYAISQILLDKNIAKEHRVKDAAKDLIRNVITIEDKESKRVLTEFGHLIPDLCDDLRGIRLIIMLIRQSLNSFIGPISILVPTFVKFSKRTDCAPDVNKLVDLHNKDFVIEYLKLFTEMILDVFENFKKKRSQQMAVISLLNMTLTQNLVEIIPEEIMSKLKRKLEFQQRQWKKSNSTDDYVVNDLLNVLVNRISEIPFKADCNSVE